jgi:hypothetical protein
MSKDVIISALACGGKMSCYKQAAEFNEPPVVININSSAGVSTGGSTVQGFRKAAGTYKKNGQGSILNGVLGTQKNLEPRRVAIVSYLDGWSFIHEILKTPDWERIDTVIVLEGLNTRSTQIWERYANRGRLWLAYTKAPHKTASCQSAARNIVPFFINECRTELPEYLLHAKLDKSISIYSKTENPKTKIFHEDPLLCGEWASRSIVALPYNGKTVQDQTYIQQYVQPRLWRWLAELWSDSTTGVII